MPERIVPDGCPEIIAHLGDTFSRRIGARWQRQPRIFLAGTLTRPWMVRSGKRVLTVGLRFRPAGFTALFGQSLANTADREIPLANLLGRRARRDLLDRLATARSTESRLAAAATWLVENARRGVARSSIAPAIDIIVKARGQVRIAEIAELLGCQRRQLERIFARDLGIGPKVYARIVRLNAVLVRLDRTERSSAVDVALQAGYFDQAHLLRDFRLLAGRLPRRGGARDGALAENFTRPERLRLLFLGD
jgi:AraC-like DNA-binding protein